MPNVSKTVRQNIHDGKLPEDAGELCFKLSTVIQEFLDSRPNGGFNGGIAPILAAIEALDEAFKAEIVRPYETLKRIQNGAVFSWPLVNHPSLFKENNQTNK
jgi:hypothetical protein